jgi:uncharacterized DUF497 family protein
MAADIRERLASCTGFDWDEGNASKLLARHRVSPAECEQVFFNEPLVIAEDAAHSIDEPRWAVWGRTAEGRALAVVFTLRRDRIQPLSAREQRLGIRTVGLVPGPVGRDIARMQQQNPMTEPLQLAPPVMGRAAGLQQHLRGGPIREVERERSTGQPLALAHLTGHGLVASPGT